VSGSEATKQLNADIVLSLYKEVKDASKSDGQQLQKFVAAMLKFGLFVRKNADRSITAKATDDGQCVFCLEAAKKHLLLRGFPQISELQEMIGKVDMFLQEKMRKELEK